MMARGAKKPQAPTLVLERAPHRADSRVSSRRRGKRRSTALWLGIQGAIAVSAVVGITNSTLPSRELHVPDHMLQTAFFEEELLSPKAAKELFALIKRMKEFPTNINDVQFYKTRHEHIGEAMALTPNESCADPLFVPNSDRTLCVLPGRIDVGRHYILTGGFDGSREPFDWLVSRVQSFGRYMFDLAQYPEAAALFDDPRFIELARQVCPADKQHLDPFQFNFILQVPGQTVAAHIDGAYFWGATRFQYPQWLLAAMVFSGRFAERFVDQVQVVAYLHEWAPSSRMNGGDGKFVHWANGSAPSIRSPLPRAGSAIDGSKSVHAAEVYLGSPSSPPLPLLDKNRANVLSFEGPSDTAGWVLRADSSEVLQRYHTDDLRVSIVYRARCFASVSEAARFGGDGGPAEQRLGLEDILHTLADEMVQRGKISSVQEAMKLDRRALAIKIIDTFIKYPLPPVDRAPLMPYNYCALARLLQGSLQTVVTMILKPLCMDPPATAAAAS